MNQVTKKLFQDLTDKLNLWNYEYYTKDAPSVDDSVYDAVKVSLTNLEKQYPEYVCEDSPIGKVYEAKTIQETKAPMLSLRTETDYTIEGAKAFVRSVEKRLGHTPQSGYYAELKYDGLAINVRYCYGQLTSVHTRQDEDVTHNAYLLNLPPYVAALSAYSIFDVRGEALMEQPVFFACNKQLQEKGLKRYVNMRNAASGVLRQKKKSELVGLSLSFKPYSYGVIEGADVPFKTQQAFLAFIKHECGFEGAYVNSSKACYNAQELYAYLEEVQEYRGNMVFDIDGVVYKVNSIEEQQRIGWATDYPHWAMAHKFMPQAGMTTILDIVFPTGRTGQITPQAVVEPVFVSGTTITHVNLFNEDEINRLGVDVGDTVLVQRSGDVIPRIVSRVGEPRENKFDMYVRLNAQCVFCNSPITKRDGGVHWYCTGGVNCPAQKLAMFTHFVSKKAVYIEGLGETILSNLIELNILHDFPDVLNLTAEQLSQAGVGPKVSEKILANIQTVRAGVEGPALIYAMGIPGVGITTAKELYHAFGVGKLVDRDLIEYKEVLGSASAVVVYNWVSENNYNNRGRWYKLTSCFCKIDPPKMSIIKDAEQIEFVVTGKFEVSRDAIVNKYEAMGYIHSDKVTKNTKYLFVGDKPSAAKLAAAQKYGCTIVTQL